MNKVLISIIGLLLLSASGNTFSQSETNKLLWIQHGNCWVAEEGFLFCGSTHPETTEDSKPFLVFTCFQDYHAVLLNHDLVQTKSTVREIQFEIFLEDRSGQQFVDMWMAPEPKESFLSNRVDPANQGFTNLLKALSKPKIKELKFKIIPDDIYGRISLAGGEWKAAQAFFDNCQN